MKKHSLKLLFIMLLSLSLIDLYGQGRVGISPTGQDPDASAALDVVSPDKGVLIPRMNSVTRMSIPAPGNGLLVYDTDSNCIFFYRQASTSWFSLCQIAAGLAGPQGPIGLTGATGPQGPAGTNGTAGATGPQGPIGLTGATGPQGTAGTNGAAGATGPQGPAGPQGPIGLTGSTGPQGPAGTNGAAGATGPQGPIGLTGATGPQGPAGTTGAAGATGPQGPAGPQGPIGLTGAAGAAGAVGPQGPAGPVGCATPNYIIKSDGTNATCTVAPIFEDATGKVGIGTTTPADKLSVGSASEFRVNTSGDLARIKNVPYSWPSSNPGGTTGNYYLRNNGSGTLIWDNLALNTFGTNNQGVTGTTDCTINSTTFADISQMTITFTPVHSIVYVFFTIAGYENVTGSPQQYVDFRVLRGGTVVGGGNCTAGDYDDSKGVVSSFNGALSLAVPVTAGVSTTIKVQWRRDGNTTTAIYCNALSAPDYNHRSLIIID
jgi:hypothetical protein